MDSIVIDPLPFNMDLSQMFQAFRVREGSETAVEVGRLAEEAQAIARPKVIYRLGFIDSKETDHVIIDGVRFTSRVLRVNLDAAQRIIAYVITSGRELATWADSQTDLLARFWADRINQVVLGAASRSFDAYLHDLYSLTRTSHMNPGSLSDWPLKEQRVLFGFLGDVRGAVGVELTESLLMVPTKSVSGIQFPSEETFASCQLCPRPGCPNRRAPYDAMLAERKYRLREEPRKVVDTSVASAM